MIEVIEKGYERKFVCECDKCKSVFTYKIEDIVCRRIACPMCDNVIYVDFTPYRGSE